MGETLLTSWEDQPVEEDLGDGFTVTRLTLSAGDPHTMAIFDAVVDRYNDVSGRVRPTEASIEAFEGQKVTLVQHGENMLGGGILAAEEGKIFHGTGGALGLLPKGKRSKGIRVRPDRVLDILPGYAAADAAEMVREVRAHFPQVRAFTQERLEALPYQSDTLSVCLFGTYRMPDDDQSDAIYLLSGYYGQEDDIAEGIVLLRPSIGTSEHGSVYGRQLLHSHRMGEVLGFAPISYGEGFALCNLDFEDAYERLLGNCVAA